jgi:tetratricopeptide (TPR) repeat protein
MEGREMLSRLRIVFFGSVTVALLLVPGVALGQGVDQVFLTKGPPSRGTIADAGMSRDKVQLDSGGAGRDIAVNEIVRITYKEEPSELSSGRNHAIQRNYAQGLAELKKLDGRRIDRALVKQDIEYYRALCQCKLAMSEGGDKAAASAAMVSFVSKAPQSYHFYEAAEVLGDVAMASGKWADAVKYYGPIASAGATLGEPWPDYQMRANNALGRANLGEKQFGEALTKFQAVIGADASTPEAIRQKNLAQVGRAVCLAETGKAAEGINILQDLINKNDPQDGALFARAYNALGRCYLKQGKTKEAVLALLHTDVLFFNEADAHAEALYHLSKLWSEVNKSDRATAARTTLKQRYAGSIWATLE